MFFDLPLEQLREYRPDVPCPSDFDEFWARSLAECRQHDLAPTVRPYDAGLELVEVHDVTFAGWGGNPVAAWMLRPRGAAERLPVVVHYVGYGAGRGLPIDQLLWSAAGYAQLVVDARGQGSSINSIGATTDDVVSPGPHVPGFLTMGIESRERYYYRRLFTDSVRAVDFVRSRPDLDPDAIFLSGMSQGGGIALAVNGLVPEVRGLMADVPFLCHIRRATEITDSRPYLEIAQYCAAHRANVEAVFETLSYFDGVNFAARAETPALFSVALMDVVCPPSTVFAAYNHYRGADKQMSVYAYNGHEGGGAFQREAQLAFVRQRLELGA